MTNTEFDRLVNLHLDGALSPEEKRRLESELEARPDRRERWERASRLNDACREALFRLAAESSPLAAVPERRRPAAGWNWATGLAAAVTALAVPGWLVMSHVANQAVPEPGRAPIELAAADAVVSEASNRAGMPQAERTASAATFASFNFDSATVSAEDLLRVLQQRAPVTVAELPVPRFLPGPSLDLQAPQLPAGSVVPVRAHEALRSSTWRNAVTAGREHQRFHLATVRFGW